MQKFIVQWSSERIYLIYFCTVINLLLNTIAMHFPFGWLSWKRINDCISDRNRAKFSWTHLGAYRIYRKYLNKCMFIVHHIKHKKAIDWNTQWATNIYWFLLFNLFKPLYLFSVHVNSNLLHWIFRGTFVNDHIQPLTI